MNTIAYGFYRSGVYYSLSWEKSGPVYRKNGRRISELEFELAKSYKYSDGRSMLRREN